VSKFQLTPVTGLPQVNGWSQAISHPSGSLFCVLAVEGQNANSIGKNLTEFLLSKEINNSATLHNVLLDLLQKAREELCKVQLACLVISSESRVIAATHKGSVCLKRNEKVGEILFSDGDLKIIEGSFQENDVFSLSTEKAKTMFPQLKEDLKSSTEKIATKLISSIQEQEDSALAAIALLEQSEEIIEEKKPTNPIKNIDLEKLRKKARVLVGYLKKIKLTKIKNLSKKIFKKPVFMNDKVDEEQKNNIQLFLKITFIAITILVAIISWKQQSLKKELEPITPILESISQRFENLKINQDASPIEKRSESRLLLKELEDLISQNQDKKYTLEEIKKNYQEIQEFSESISGIETQGPLDPFFDLRLADPSFVAKQTTINEETLFALDASGKFGITVDLKNKKTSKFSLEDMDKEAASIAISEDYIFTIGNGIHSFDLSGEKEHKQLKEEGDSDRSGTILKSYGSYLYILNPEKRNIYRYLLKDGELSEPIGWLIDKQDLDFSSIESMAIDGDMWITDKDGNIFKYTQGKKQEFSVKNISEEFDGPIKITTSEESEYLYILDKNKKKLTILQKDGEFVREIVSESLASGENIVTSKENEVLVVSGSLIYKIMP
jgi:hypothetical protein